ncbi:EamA family transporter [Rhodobacterales bacterium 59_46_T64]|nr:EamA family transporter [Rhodobacterales bacterium 59_46_T64]
MSDNMRGALFMMLSMAGFTISDSLMKQLTVDLPLSQVILLRGIVTTALTLGLAWRMGALRMALPRREWGLVFWRLVGEIGAAYFFLTALKYMPLANMTAVMQSLPLTVTLAAAVLFREPVGWRRMGAILAGLFGVVLILQPGPEGFNHYSIYALVAVGFVTLRDLCTRRLSRETPSLLVTVITAVAVTGVFGVVSIGVEWQPVGGVQGAQLAASGSFVFVGYLCAITAMRSGDIAVVSPFRYTALIWALMLGWLVFGDWPSGVTMLGVMIVAGSGLYTLYRERQLRIRTEQLAARAGSSRGI